MSKTPEQIVALVRSAGVVGAGGLGYPTHLKLQSKVDTVIVNGSECEPLLYTDQSILKDKSEDVVEGLKIALIAMNAKEGVIAINRKFKDAVSAIEKVCLNAPQIRVHLLEDYYPSGDEYLMVYDVTKKVIPENGTPITVGVAVYNVSTVVQIFQAVNGKPSTERRVTVTGEVKEPKVMRVPLGTRYSELIALAGGSRLKDYAVLDGGPMMGNLISNLENGIGKSTRALVVLPKDHFVIQMKAKTLSRTIKELKAASGQNTLSTDLCPRYLLGHQILPHEALIGLDYQRSEPSQTITAAFLCSGCGLCELIGNEANFVSPQKIYREYQRLFQKANIKNPHARAPTQVHSQFENRKISTPTLLKRLHLSQYDKKLSTENSNSISLVKIPLQKPWGTPSQVSIQLGQTVRRGDIIAESFSDDFESVDHASIHGTVSNITDDFIEITGFPA